MSVSTPSASAPDILIVDDTPANLQLLAGMLKERGYKVRPVPNGELALRAARQSPPDLVLLDINMPEVNGYQLCAQLKRDERMTDVPVIFISALNETIDKVHAFAVGGVDYITKPFQFEEVDARVAAHLKLRRLQKDLELRNCELYQTNTELRRAQELRDNLTHMIVHDLRSPLTGVLGAFDLIALESDRLSAETRDFLKTSRGALDHVLTMITSLLDVSRIEAGELQPKRAKCDLVQVARKSIELMEPLRGKRTITFESSCDTLTITIDQELISRVFLNLIGNALKFTSSNGTVRLNIVRRSPGAYVTVSDNGPGISQEFHQRIFEKFGQVKSDHATVGTGLGLTFCRLAVEAHGGNMGVVSEIGNGSTFWFELPDTSRLLDEPSQDLAPAATCE